MKPNKPAAFEGLIKGQLPPLLRHFLSMPRARQQDGHTEIYREPVALCGPYDKCSLSSRWETKKAEAALRLISRVEAGLLSQLIAGGASLFFAPGGEPEFMEWSAPFGSGNVFEGEWHCDCGLSIPTRRKKGGGW